MGSMSQRSKVFHGEQLFCTKHGICHHHALNNAEPHMFRAFTLFQRGGQAQSLCKHHAILHKGLECEGLWGMTRAPLQELRSQVQRRGWWRTQVSARLRTRTAALQAVFPGKSASLH